MQILLDKPELEQFIRSQVDGGQYTSPVAVIEAALSEFMAKDFAPGEIDRLIAEGEASLAKHGPLKFEDVYSELKQLRDPARIQARK